MRIVLMMFVVAFALAGCAKKQKAAQAPAPPAAEMKAADSPAEETGAGAPSEQDKASGEGDPCDGGENKKK